MFSRKIQGKRWLIAILCVIMATVILWFHIPNSAHAEAAEKIQSTFTEIEKQIEASMDFDGKYYVNGLPLALSSNPYDYIENSDEYKKLIAIGTDAISVIEECLDSKENYNGIEQYILAIALQDISKVELKNYEEYAWADVNAFLMSWEKAKDDVVIKVPQILSDASLSSEEKWVEIAKFGTLAIAPLQEFQIQAEADDMDSSLTELSFKMINVLTTSSKNTVVDISISEILPPS